MHRILFSYLGLASIVASSIANYEGAVPVTHSGCGSSIPSEALKITYRNLSTAEDFDSLRLSNSVILVDTWFHVVSSNASLDFVTDDMVESQIDYLQSTYANTGISYNLIGFDRTVNDAWARNENDVAMKKALRRGSYDTLNIYFQTDLQPDPSGNSPAGRSSSSDGEPVANLLGFCTLPNPEITAVSRPIDYVEDGCNVLAASMPGGPIPHYSLGGTAVHEVGHWHGLLHTFQGETCDPGNDGDYIADTPIQSIPTDGCPAVKDSCPKDPGLDLIHNFMDYSSDDCYQNFTPNQAKRMRDMWYIMRMGK